MVDLEVEVPGAVWGSRLDTYGTVSLALLFSSTAFRSAVYFQKVSKRLVVLTVRPRIVMVSGSKSALTSLDMAKKWTFAKTEDV